MEHFHLVARVEAGGIAVEGVVVQIKSLISMSGVVIQVAFRHVQRIRRQIAAATQFLHYAARLVIVSESIFIYGILVDILSGSALASALASGEERQPAQNIKNNANSSVLIATNNHSQR